MIKDRKIVSVSVSDGTLTATYNGKVGFQLDICLRTVIDFILGLKGGKA